MKGHFRKTIEGYLIPADEQTSERVRKIKAGEVIEVEYKKKRNWKFHRKFFALVQLVFENQDKYENLNDLLTELKLQVGHYDEHVTLGGKVTYQPKSISFDSMDEIEFGEFYNKVVEVILKYFLRGMDADELDAMVDQVIGFV